MSIEKVAFLHVLNRNEEVKEGGSTVTIVDVTV